MVMRRLILAELFLLLLLLGGCTSVEQAEPPQQLYTAPQYDWQQSGGETLVIWASSPDGDRVYLKRAFERYEQLTGGEIELVQYSPEEYKNRTEAAFRGCAVQPDLLLGYGGTNIERLYPDDNFYDFSDAIWVDDLTDTAINQTIYDGRVVGLPHWEASISGTLYNKELFQKYGLSVPETQAEFLAVCQALLDHGVTPLYLPGQQASMLLYQFPLDTIVEDTEVLSALNSGQLGYADLPGMQAVVDWYRTMAERGYLGDSYKTGSWDGMNQALESGKYAMMLCWDTWLYTDFQGDPEQFGLMPAFVGVPEQGTFEGPNLSLLMVNRNGPQVEQALNLITFLADPYNYNVAFEGIYTAPVFKHQAASISTPQYMQAERLIDRNFHDSTAWLRIRGFSQDDASCILDYMEQGGAALDCLREMDRLRAARFVP